MVKDFSRKHISLFAKIAFCLFAICVLLKITAVLSSPFADFFNRYISSVPRTVFAHVTSVFPFSLAEAIIIMAIPLALIYLVYCATVVAKRGKLLCHIFNLLGIICLVLSFFIINFSIAYDCTPIEDKLSMPTGDLSVNDVYAAAEIALEEIKELENEIVRDENGAAIMPYTYHEMNVRLNGAYHDIYADYPFLSPLYIGTKRVALSKLMSYTGITGVYTFFTGEANVNTNGADYSVTYTAAHEMAHQRGIAPEDEANFVAFLALYNSSDKYLKYSGLMEIFNYMAHAIYKEDADMYYELLESFSDNVLDEFVTEQENLEQYRDNIASDISSAVNDAYLKTQGQKEGTKSYGLVTDLATVFFLNK